MCPNFAIIQPSPHVNQMPMRKHTTALSLGILFAVATTFCRPGNAATFIANALESKGPGSNDKFDNVVTLIENLKNTNDPDLPTEFWLFKKTDDDAAFVFDAANGFSFFDAGTGGEAITSAGDLHSTDTAWFEYSGPEDILFYSVKSGSTVGFSLYQFVPGERNILTAHGSDQDISHVSIWVPEPSSFLLSASCLFGLTIFGRRKRHAVHD